MKFIKYNLLIALFIVTSCVNIEKKENDESETNSITELGISEKENDNPDKTEIESLIKNMYRWQENYQPKMGRDEIIKDSLIVGLDKKQHETYLKTLDETGFFAKEFLTNMTHIHETLNKMLKSGKVKWYDGDMSPFGDDSSPWCNCQDVPTDNDPYGIIKFTFSKLDNNEATLNWSWDIREDWKGFPNYKIRTVKEDGKWKIAWMQGWNHDTSTEINY